VVKSFLFLLYETSLEDALTLAQRACQEIHQHNIRTATGEEVSVSLSIGVSQLEPNIDTHIESIIKRADQALYEAKAAGKNRVNSRSSDSPTHHSMHI
jgi:diguanylate cyclase (GGDEF)-like protein